MSRATIITNLLAYQAAWFASVLGAAADRPWIGLLAVTIALTWHLARAHSLARELRLIGACLLIGAAFESLLISSGLVRMSPALLTGGVVPFWMAGVWAAFGSTLNVSLRSFRTHRLACTLAAAIGAPLAYLSGARLGAFEWTDTLVAMALIGTGWALIMPLLLKLALRFDGYAP